MCGKSTLQWDVYSTAIRYLVFEQFLEEFDLQAHKNIIAIDVRNVLRDYIHEAPSFEPNSNSQDGEDEQDQRTVFLSSCLTDLIQLQATEPKDKIYGVHSLYRTLGIPLPAVSYEKSTARVYEEAAVAMIVWSGTLKVLSDACRSPLNLSLPSWVPDWSNENIKMFTPAGDATSGSKITESSSETLNPIPGELHVQGKVIGRVNAWRHRSFAAVFPSRPEECELLTFTDKISSIGDDVDTVRLWVEKIRFFRKLYCFLRAHPAYCHEVDVEEVLSDLLHHDSYSEPHEIFKAWINILKYPETKYDLTRGEFLVDEWKPVEASAAKHWTEEQTSCAVIMASLLTNSVMHDGGLLTHTADILELMTEFSMNLSDKTLLLVRLNSIGKTVLGTGFHTTTTGDAVVLLEGAEWPVILRQIGSRWRFIGLAYVSGAMDGEVWSDESGELGEMSTFVLT
jgi:hypothetical protein